MDNLPKLAHRVDRPRGQRLYGKDLDCPPVWQTALGMLLPKYTFYLNPSADLMSSLPPNARAENMMCYIGHEGTYTPAHKEMCGSLGQNIMVNASSNGSSLWFMTKAGDRELVTDYWVSKLGHDLEVEGHFASIDDLRDAGFDVYVHEQKIGDFILVPAMAPHQVWNRGDFTIKAAWNRTTAETLELAINESLPKMRLVCRDEQYKNRNIIHETLRNYYEVLTGGKARPENMLFNKMQSDFVRLFDLFNRILLDECFSPHLPTPIVEKIPNDYNVTCSFCRGCIYNRFLTCKNCVYYPEGENDPDQYDICMDCYVRGRSCMCVSNLEWVEQHDWPELVQQHQDFRAACEHFGLAEVPKSLADQIKAPPRKTLAWVCQEQLIARPFKDITKDGMEDIVSIGLVNLQRSFTNAFYRKMKTLLSTPRRPTLSVRLVTAVVSAMINGSPLSVTTAAPPTVSGTFGVLSRWIRLMM